MKGFNPRPGHATGATQGTSQHLRKETVSIRAPVTRPGRRDFQKWKNFVREFQSAPRSRDRGDPVTRVSRELTPCFNPRPGHATGATSRHRLG